MSVSRVSTTSGLMAGAAAVTQVQAVQYASSFSELKDAVETGDLQRSRVTLNEFQRVAAGAASSGIDPIRQIPVLSRDFMAIRNALRKGDMKAAQDSLSSLKVNLGFVSPDLTEQPTASSLVAVLAPDATPNARPTVRKLADESVKDDAPIVLENLGFLGADSELLREVRSIRTPAPSRNSTSTSSTFIRSRPELTSFSQKAQVFPTYDPVAKLSVPVANNSLQAQIVVQGLAATQPNAQMADLDGTTFAPTPELMLGSKGISIPPGAELQFSNNPILLRTVSF